MGIRDEPGDKARTFAGDKRDLAVGPRKSCSTHKRNIRNIVSKQARDPARFDPSEYRKVAMEIREDFGSLPKKTPSIVTGSTFNRDFGGEETPSNTNDTKGKGKSTGRKGRHNLGRKRGTPREEDNTMPGMRL